MYLYRSIFFIFFSINVLADQQLDNLVNKYHQNKSFHGNIVVLKKGQVVYKKSVGLAIQEFEVPHTFESKFMIASLSKQFTAALIMKAIEENKFSLNSRVADLIKLPKNHTLSAPDLKWWNQITVKHLLTHTAGFKRDVSSGDNLHITAYNSLPTIVSSQLRASRLGGRSLFINEPRDKYYYSNFGYMLLANIILELGVLFENELQKVLLNPLNMLNTGSFHRIKFISKMSQGYFYNDDYKLSKRCCNDASTFVGSHSLYSNIDDLIKWVNELFYNNNIISKDSVSLMTEGQLTKQQIQDGFADSQYGFGFFIDEFQGYKRIWHNGHEMGFISLLTHLPELELSVIMLSNRQGHVMDPLFSEKMHEELLNVLVSNKQLSN